MNHETLSKQDQIALIAELEHSIRHALRSSKVAEKKEDKFFYAVTAQQLKNLRREYMAKHFPNLDQKDWCLLKSLSTIRQLSYELFDGDQDWFDQLENVVDSTTSRALGVDLTQCESCTRDKQKTDPEESV